MTKSAIVFGMLLVAAGAEANQDAEAFCATKQKPGIYQSGEQLFLCPEKEQWITPEYTIRVDKQGRVIWTPSLNQSS